MVKMLDMGENQKVQMLVNYLIIQERESRRESKRSKGSTKNKDHSPKLPVPNVVYNVSKYFNQNPSDLIQGTSNMVPVFVDKCVTYLDKNAVKVEGIYRISPNNKDRDNFIRKFDADNNLNFELLTTTVHVIAAALKWFFSDKNMPDPLIPHHLHEELKGAMAMPESSIKVCSLRGSYRKLPVANYSTFKFLCTHLSRIAENGEVNKMDATNLATCWWPNFFHPNLSSQPDLVYGDILKLTILQCPFIFHDKPEKVFPKSS